MTIGNISYNNQGSLVATTTGSILVNSVANGTQTGSLMNLVGYNGVTVQGNVLKAGEKMESGRRLQ